jgi:hypothetical protein
MTFEDISKSLNSLLATVLEWLDTCLHPLRHCDELLSLSDEQQKISRSLRLWLVIFLITLILELPLLKTAGIEWSDAGFHLPYFLALTMVFAVDGAMMHLGMRVYGINSNIGDTLCAYTALIGVYGPLFTLASYPESVRLFTSLRSAKIQGLQFMPAIDLMLKSQAAASRVAGLQTLLVPFLALPAQVGILAAQTALAYKLSSRYAAPKSRILSSFAFSFSVLTVPLILSLGVFVSFIVYVFIKV